MSCGPRSSSRPSQRAEACSTRRSPATSRASSAGSSGSACTRSRSSSCSWRSGVPTARRGTCIALPIVGAGVSLYHMLIGYGAITEPKRCSIGVPGGCGINWIQTAELRLPRDRNARVHRVPSSHRILGPCKHRDRRRRGYPGSRCLAERKRDNSAKLAVAAPPPVRSTGGAGSRQASPKVLGIAGGVILVVIVAIVLAVVLSRNNASTSGGASGYDGPTIGIAVRHTGDRKLLEGERAAGRVGCRNPPQGHPAEGHGPRKAQRSSDARRVHRPPVLRCDQFETTEFSPLVQKYVRTGKMKIVMQPWNIIDANSTASTTRSAARRPRSRRPSRTRRSTSPRSSTKPGQRGYRLAEQRNGLEHRRERRRAQARPARAGRELLRDAERHQGGSTPTPLARPRLHAARRRSSSRRAARRRSLYVTGCPGAGSHVSKPTIDALLNQKRSARTKARKERLSFSSRS